MIDEGLGLLAAGMGMVFVFLTLLVLVMDISARLFSRLLHLSAEEGPKPPRHQGEANQTREDLGEISAAIAAAAARARARGGNQRHGEKDR